MDRSIPLLLIGLVFGGGVGFAVAASNGITLTGHDHADPAQHAGAAEEAAHHHGHDMPVEVTGPAAPSLAVEVFEDPAAGWNLHLLTENFAFAPERASQAHVPGEGHAHVYVNGVKIGRYYGPWLHLDALPAGEVTIEVTLNANDHRALAVGGVPVAATVVIAN